MGNTLRADKLLAHLYLQPRTYIYSVSHKPIRDIIHIQRARAGNVIAKTTRLFHRRGQCCRSEDEKRTGKCKGGGYCYGFAALRRTPRSRSPSFSSNLILARKLLPLSLVYHSLSLSHTHTHMYTQRRCRRRRRRRRIRGNERERRRISLRPGLHNRGAEASAPR